MKLRYFFMAILLSQIGYAQSQMSLEECQTLFQKNSLLLLAQHYNIDVAQAALIQAKIWEQPYVSGELNLLNPEARRWADIGTQTGQKVFGVEQLIYMGGKKKREVEFFRHNIQLAQLEYEHLLRRLKFEISQSFYEIYFDQIQLELIQEQIGSIERLIEAFSKQVEKGNEPLKDVVRLQSLSMALKKDLLELQQSIFEHQQRLKALLNTNENIFPIPAPDLESKYAALSQFSESQLQEKALANNTEYLLYVRLVENQQLYLQWQKALSVPDFTLGLAYDQRGGGF